jgi:WD40 repeat protein
MTKKNPRTGAQRASGGKPTELPPGVKLLRSLEGHQGRIWSAAFDPRGETLASGSRDSTVKLWETRSGKLVRTLEGHKKDIYSVAFDPKGATLASGSGDQTVKLWEARSGKLLCTLKGHGSGVNSVAFDPQGGTLASGSMTTR